VIDLYSAGSVAGAGIERPVRSERKPTNRLRGVLLKPVGNEYLLDTGGNVAIGLEAR
jgi:hypothetical protein